ncbi:TetR/AcrR family transcriptional regulator [Paenibacillus agilis]|uniref:TetR/AcrR family transcriptional regulator n=1 Tax=Paenibacillus agilis TaxID=3020863 RepID=A0A559IKI8_9BACL|nr:TetR/AcrR family transcriptional regulator [Paenibacillus agilis]TVX88060.1 TetR/AcrR family transcriptional regulator [Paenibacillus agilis]
MRQFAQSGVNGLVIEKMSSELGCSKSSFYWYFKSRDEFIARLIERWVELSTQQVILSSSEPENAEDQITKMLIEMFSVTRKGDFLFYLRKLSEEATAFYTMLETIEQTRMSYAAALFKKVGMDPEVAEQKSHILYHYYLGWYERFKKDQVEDEELDRHIKMLRAHLLGM